MTRILDIARAVGVSSATVSRVLNGDPTISVGEAKRRAIIETAAEMNYQTPRNRRGKRLGTIAIINFLRPAEELGDPYYVSLRLGIENRCQELRIEATNIYGPPQASQATLLQATTGAIVIGLEEGQDASWLSRYGRNVVFADCVPTDGDHDLVTTNVGGAADNLLNKLDKLGYQRIAYVGWTCGDGAREADEVRYRTYVDWINRRGGFDQDLCAVASNPTGREWEKLGYSLTNWVIEKPVLPDAILAFNDSAAVGVYRALQQRGIRIPEDVAVASFNDISVARYLTPPLSTVRLPAEAIGETAVDLLAERIRGRRVAKQVTLATEMIWRDSTRAAK